VINGRLISVSVELESSFLAFSAADKATGKSQEIKISGSSGLSEEEIEKMVQDAEKHKAEDEKRKEMVDLRNQADSLVAQTEKTLTDMADQV